MSGLWLGTECDLDMCLWPPVANQQALPKNILKTHKRLECFLLTYIYYSIIITFILHKCWFNLKITLN